MTDKKAIFEQIKELVINFEALRGYRPYSSTASFTASRLCMEDPHIGLQVGRIPGGGYMAPFEAIAFAKANGKGHLAEYRDYDTPLSVPGYLGIAQGWADYIILEPVNH